MASKLEILAQVLTTPLLESEISGEQIGRNRLRVIQKISEVLDNAEIQIWLVERQGDEIKSRLAYWFPKPHIHDLPKLKGHIVVENSTSHRSINEPSAALLRSAKSLFKNTGTDLEGVHAFPVRTPIPNHLDRERNQRNDDLPLAWVFAAKNTELHPAQLASAQIVVFNLSILLEYGRSHRIVQATNTCTELLHGSLTLDETLGACADVLVKSCAAEGGGYLEFVNGKLNSIHYTTTSNLTDAQRQAIENYITSDVGCIPTLREIAIRAYDGRERHTNRQFGNLLFVPIIGQGFSLDTTEFLPISDSDENLGYPCEFFARALFLTRKKSPEYLGNNFSATDKILCQAIAKTLSSSAFSKYFQQLFLRQAGYFSKASFADDVDITDALEHIKLIVPGASSLHRVAVFRNTSGEFEIEQTGSSSEGLPDAVMEHLLAQSKKVYPALVKSGAEFNALCELCGRPGLIFSDFPNDDSLRSAAILRSMVRLPARGDFSA